MTNDTEEGQRMKHHPVIVLITKKCLFNSIDSFKRWVGLELMIYLASLFEHIAIMNKISVCSKAEVA